MPEAFGAQWLRKVAHVVGTAGRQVASRVLLLHFAVQDDDVPSSVKVAILASLAYFVNPVDLVPDALPGGLADDFAVLGAVLAVLGRHVAPEVVERAEQAANTLIAKILKGKH